MMLQLTAKQIIIPTYFDLIISSARHLGMGCIDVCVPQDQFLDTRMVLTTCLASCNNMLTASSSFCVST